ncbi:MAG: TIGR00730 family Rossman fold protein [Actinomycetota bacterium]|nr:TIGR00730 family Rossman fold protein [Actinomycetota bacterium]
MAAVCVFCASSTRVAESYVRLAGEVGSEIARRGHALVSGGGDVSMMGAVARSARAGGAHTTGVIPRVLLDLEVGDRDADELLVVDDMRARKGLMDERSDAFLALPGGLGTLEELTEVWVARLLGLHAKPVVALDVDGLYDPLRQQIDVMLERGFVRPKAVGALVWTSSVAEALDAVEAGLGVSEPLRPEPAEVLEAEP